MTGASVNALQPPAHNSLPITGWGGLVDSVKYRKVLFACYVLRLSLRDVADLFETNCMQVRNLLSGDENFVNGGLVALGVRLDMDLVLYPWWVMAAKVYVPLLQPVPLHVCGLQWTSKHLQ
ncbi:hypothetical protein ACGVWS_15090 [Enterobacteriaceae bacterium LUAb1]